MIISLQTKSTEKLENYLKNYQNPKNIFIQMIHNISFTNKSITRIDDIIVIEQESFMSMFARYAMLPSVTMIILGMIFNYYWLLNIGSLGLILSMTLLSKYVLAIMIMIKLRLIGHKENVKYITDGFLLNRLLLEYRVHEIMSYGVKDGSTRNLRDTKK